MSYMNRINAINAVADLSAPEPAPASTIEPLCYAEDVFNTAAMREYLPKDTCEKLLATLPTELRGSFTPLLSGEVQERQRDLVKAADKLSAYVKCIEERKAGNNEFLSAEAQTRRILEESA
ncbi:MAG: hypothetical protein IKX19_07080, partial [Clostridia bacterium]|nr:hypothetical protein [Clostridia bacterium]